MSAATITRRPVQAGTDHAGGPARRAVIRWAAVGGSSRVRRTITGATAGAIGLLGAILGAAGATIAGAAWARSSLSTAFGDFPAWDPIAILVGLPLVAAAGGWLLAGRQPPVIARQALE